MNARKWPLAAIAMLAATFVGCDSSQVTGPDQTAPAAETADPMDHDAAHDGHDMDGHDHTAHDSGNDSAVTKTKTSDMDKMMETLAALPDDDRKSAMTQHFCPVSGEMLGVMGLPEKVDVEGKMVWICCGGCKDKLLAESEKYLAKLSK